MNDAFVVLNSLSNDTIATARYEYSTQFVYDEREKWHSFRQKVTGPIISL